MRSAAFKYLTAFASGYVGALVPVFVSGHLPERPALVAAIGAGLVATGLFHCPSPTSRR